MYQFLEIGEVFICAHNAQLEIFPADAGEGCEQLVKPFALEIVAEEKEVEGVGFEVVVAQEGGSVFRPCIKKN